MSGTFFFDADEEIALLKKYVILKIHPRLDEFEPFFRAAHRSLKHGARSHPLDTYTIDGLLFLLTSRSFIDDYQEHASLMHDVIASNYKLETDQSRILMAALGDLCHQEEIIISFCNKMRQRKDAMLRTHKFEQVMELYRRHLTPRYYEKKNLGQVFTPFPLIDKILDQIPNDVMTDPDSTFLDPSAGMGGFLVCLHRRLMGTLSDAIPNQKKRHHHIVSKMLFAAEITANNVALMKKVFGDDLHVYHGDALQMNLEKAFGLKKGVRVIVGNPPFEKPPKNDDADTKRGGGNSLWPEFVEKCLTEWLLPGGYLGMLLPPGWRRPSDEKTKAGLWNLMTEQNTPLWVEMFDLRQASSFFDDKVQIRADLVMVRKGRNPGVKTRIWGTDKKQVKEDLRKLPFLPNANLSQWKRLLTKNGVSVLHSAVYYSHGKVRKNRDGAFRHPVIHSIHKDGKLIVRYADKKLEAGGFGVPKVVFRKLGDWNKPFLDAKGTYGMTENAFAIPVRDAKDGKEIARYFSSTRLAQFGSDLIWATSQPNIDWKMLRHLKKGFWRL